MAGAALPDSLKVELAGPGVNSAGKKLAQRDWAEFCDLQISKAILTVTDTVEQGQNGGRSSTEVRSDKQKLILRYDADCLAAALQSGLTDWIVKLNFPGEEHLTPRTALHVEEKPDPMQVIQLASQAASAGMPVDADDVAERVGLKLIDPDDKKARRLAPLKPVDIWTIDPTIKPPAPPPPKELPPANDETPTEGDGSVEADAKPAGEEDAKAKADGETDKAKAQAEDVNASDGPTFAERNAAFLADLKDYRGNGMKIDQAYVDWLAAQYRVPTRPLNGSGTH
jgi:hypothetical protein